MRDRLLVPSVALSVALAALSLDLVAGALAAKRPKPEPCAGGRFLVAGDPLLPGGTATPDAVIVGDTASIASGCAPVRVRVKATKKGTRLTAKWKSCTGITGKAQMTGTIDPTCQTLSGKLRAKKAKLKRTFTATLGRCGDGVVDAGAGEVCEGGGACTGGTCNAATCTCTPDQTSNTPPTAAFSTGADTVAAGTPLAFDAAASTDPDGDPLTYSWSFGDGGRGGAAQLAHVFAAAGSWEVTLTVADGRGGTSTAQRTIAVTAGPPAVGTVVVDGVVRTTGGVPLQGVAVQLQGGGASGTTAGDGTVSLTIPRGIPAVLALAKDGYADQIVVVQTPAVAESAIFQAEMLAREPAQTLDAGAGGSIAGKHGSAITLPAGALATAGGAAVSGTVSLSLTPVDPITDPDVFPGAYAGITPTADEGLLLSYGTVEFGLTQNGQPLDLAPGQKATIEVPFYGNADKSGAPIALGDTVPLWSLDEQTGRWIQEGVGIVVASAASPTGFALRGEVGHFSWWNSDLFDSPPYEPKPKCCVDTNYDGECEDLSNTGYCWHYGTGPEQDILGNFGALADPPRIPQYAAETMLPVTGGVALPVPGNYPITLRSSALAGTYVGTTTLEGAPGTTEEITVVLYPAGGDTTPITIPWDEVYPIAPTEVDRYVFSATAGDPVYVRVSRSGSSVNGTVFIDGPGANDFGPATFGSSPRELGFLAPATGQYFVNVEGTFDTGNYRLEVQETGSFPLLLSTSPVDGAQGVALGATISATFATDIEPTSVTQFSFRVEVAGTPVDGTRQVSGATITFTPDAPLAGGAPHTVTLGTGIQALGGSALPTALGFGFSTVDTVGSVTPLAQGGRPWIAPLPNGEAMAVFEQTGGANQGTAASRYVPGGGWSAPVVLRGFEEEGQRVASNAAGDVIAIFRGRDTASVGSPTSVWASHWTAAGGWTTAVPIESTTTSLTGFGNLSGDFQGLELAIDAAGNAVAVFSRSNQAIWWNRYTAGVGWGTAVELEDLSTGALGYMRMTLNTAGEGFLVWSQSLGGMNEVKARRFTGGAFEAAQVVASVYSPVAAGIDADGNALVVYRATGSWRARRWDASEAAWDAGNVVLQADGSGLSFATEDDVDLVVLPDGSAIVAGHAFTTDDLVWAAHYTPGASGTAGTWDAPVPLEQDAVPTVFPAGGVRLAGSPSGKAVAVWTGHNGSGVARWKAYRPGVGWDASATTITGVEDNYRPHAAVAADGKLFAASVDESQLVVVGVRLE